MSDIASVIENEFESRREPHADRRSRSLAAWTFGALVAVTGWAVLFNVGADRWFWRDDWYLIADRDAGSLSDLFEPSNSHWTTLPLLVFRALYAVFGIRTYVPYLAAIVALHLTAAVLVRVVMRRTDVRPWLATVAAAPFVVFGPGADNIIWAFQIGFVGALVLGLVHMILADHDGPFDRRDGWGLVAGVASLMCAGVGAVMIGVVGISTLFRRGWRMALVHTAPLAVVYAGYLVVERPDLNPAGRPPLSAMWRWVKSAETGTFTALGRWNLLAAVLVAVLIAGAVVAAREQGRAVLRNASMPIALLAGGLAFAISSGTGRWILGDSQAQESRYVHLGAAFTLPALAFAAEALVRRRRALLPALMLMFLLPIPSYLGQFSKPIFRNDEQTVPAAVAVPFAKDVPGDTRPVADVFMSGVTLDFLFGAQRDGKLPAVDLPLPDTVVNEMRVRLGVAQSTRGKRGPNCRQLERLDVEPAKGTAYWFSGKLRIAARENGDLTSRALTYNAEEGDTLTVQLDDLALRVLPERGEKSFTLCDLA